MKNIAILGSTGSIGIQALEVVERNRDSFNVVALSCNTSIDILKRQIDRFDVSHAAVIDHEQARILKNNPKSAIKVLLISQALTLLILF